MSDTTIKAGGGIDWMPARVCRHCEGEFKPASAGQRYCSKAHEREAANARRDRFVTSQRVRDEHHDSDTILGGTRLLRRITEGKVELGRYVINPTTMGRVWIADVQPETS
jgi:hypothetical protein